jgi:hypothetical protein
VNILIYGKLGFFNLNFLIEINYNAQPMRPILLLLPCLLFCSLAHAQPCLQKADGLLSEALGFMKKNYYRKEGIPWDDITSEAKTKLKASGNCDDVYDIISWCFRRLN